MYGWDVGTHHIGARYGVLPEAVLVLRRAPLLGVDAAIYTDGVRLGVLLLLPLVHTVKLSVIPGSILIMHKT
jgi:hypothetical protein